MQRRDASLEALSDLGVITAAVALAWALSRFWLYPALGVPANAPLVLRPVAGFVAALVLLRRRGVSLRALGLARPRSFSIALATAVALYLAQRASAQWITPRIAALLHPSPSPSYFAALRNDLPRTVLWLAIGLVVGAFIEEVLFRGALVHLVARALGQRRGAVLLGALAQAVFFGALHAWGGAFQVVLATLYALLAAVALLGSKQGLWPLIAVHALLNTLGFVRAYTG